MFGGMFGQNRIELYQGSGHHPHTAMTLIEEGQEMDREGTAELENDPRFFTENVFDKRLAAFHALAVITTLASEQAMKMCFDLTAEYSWTANMVHVGVMQLIGFFSMVWVLVLSTTAALALSLQLFYTIRLQTAGPTGFDKAARFYQDRRIWLWRERAIFGVRWGLVFFFISTGFMLYVKLYTEGAPAVEEESEDLKLEEYRSHKILSQVVLGCFILASAWLVRLVQVHQHVFKESYASVDTCSNEANRHLVMRLW